MRALTVADGVLRKWSLADGPGQTGSLEVGAAAVSGRVVAAGRLFAAVTRQGELCLVEWTGDAPAVLDRVDTSGEIMFRPPALGVRDGVVFAVTRSTTGLSLYRVADDRLVRVGTRVRAAWRQEGTWFVTRPDGRLLLLCRDDTLVDEYPWPTQGAFHRAAGGLRLLATHRRGLLLFAVPRRGELPLLATSPEQVNRFALDHDGDVPVVVTLSIGDTARVATHSLAGDAFTPWAAPWSVTTTAAAEVAPAVRDGRAFVAVGDGNGHLAAWSGPRGGRAGRLLATDLDSGVVDLAWRPDGRLAVWCRSGVVEPAFG